MYFDSCGKTSLERETKIGSNRTVPLVSSGVLPDVGRAKQDHDSLRFLTKFEGSFLWAALFLVCNN